MTAVITVVESGRETGLASQAAMDVLIQAGTDLVRECRIHQKLSGHLDNICLAGGNDLFHLLGKAESADRQHRGLGHMLFDGLREIDVASALFIVIRIILHDCTE